MATHAFVAYRLTVSPAGHPDDFVNLTNIDGQGANLRHLAYGFMKDIQSSPFVDDSGKQYLAIPEIAPVGMATRFVGRYGHYGQPGNNVIDVQTSKLIHEFTDSDAFTTRLRNMLVVPDSSSTALLLAERYSGRGLTSIFLRELKRAFRAKYDKYILRSEGLTNGEAWQAFLANAKLAKVRVMRHYIPSDIADEPAEEHVYDLVYSAKPSRGQKFFPQVIKDRLLHGEIRPNEILGLDPEMEFDETRLEMHGDDWQKDFALDQQMPVLIYPVAGNAQQRPSDEQMYEAMEKAITELCPTLGVDLAAGWQSGVWPAGALAVALEAVRGS
jgi:hypothetical protein